METIGLIISCMISLSLILYLTSRKKKTQLQKIFIIDVILLFFDVSTKTSLQLFSYKSYYI